MSMTCVQWEIYYLDIEVINMEKIRKDFYIDLKEWEWMHIVHRLYYLRTMIKPFHPIDDDEVLKKADELGKYCILYPDGVARLRIDSDGNLTLIAGRNLKVLEMKDSKIKVPRKLNMFK